MSSIELDEAALASWGHELGAAAARAKVFVALFGPLGAGKTTLVQAACRGAGVRDPVTSPTYTLVHEYEGGDGPVAHVDLYRIEGTAQLDALGWDDLLSERGVVFVEWAERAGDELPVDRWEIRLSIPPGGSRRGVRVESMGVAPAPPSPVAREGEPC